MSIALNDVAIFLLYFFFPLDSKRKEREFWGFDKRTRRHFVLIVFFFLVF